MKLFTSLTLAASVLSTLAFAAAVNAMPSKSRNVVLVHGAFAGPESWDKVATILRHKGFHVTEVATPLTSLEDDVAATNAVVNAQDGPTILVGHSWGGVVIGEAGTNSKVSALVYIAAFGPDKGESLVALSANSPPSPGQKAIRSDAKGFLSIDPAQFPAVFAGDLPAEEASALAKKQIPISGAAFGRPAVKAAWNDKPTYYAISSNDQMLSPNTEAFFAKRMNAVTVTLDSSHVSMLSRPAEVAALIEQASQAN